MESDYGNGVMKKKVLICICNDSIQKLSDKACTTRISSHTDLPATLSLVFHFFDRITAAGPFLECASRLESFGPQLLI